MTFKVTGLTHFSTIKVDSTLRAVATVAHRHAKLVMKLKISP